MTPPPNPTNRDLLNEIRMMNQRIGALEQWQIATNAAQAAVEKYKAEEALAHQRKLDSTTSKSKAEITKQTLIVLGLVAAILYGYAHTKGYL